VWIVQISIIISSCHSRKYCAPVFQRKPYDSETTLCICSLGGDDDDKAERRGQDYHPRLR
jgi:hypothetical protein